MSTITKLSDDEAIITKCSATLSYNTRAFWHGRGRPGNNEGSETCGSNARYLINKKPFCKKHAGLHLINNYKNITVEENVKTN